MSVTTGALEVRGVRYAHLAAGDPGAPLLLFGHGTFGGKELFKPQLRRLSPHFRCVAIDWPGHGGSGVHPGGWRAEDLVEDVAALVRALGHDTAILAGVSQGGAVFTRTALAHPACVRGLITMCAGPGVPPPEAIERMRALARTLADERDEDRRRDAVAAFAAGWHVPGFARRAPAAAAAELDVMLGHPRDTVTLLPEVPAHYESIADRLAELTVPTLVIWGDADLRPQLGAELAAAIPGAILAQIPDAGHHVNVDAPGTVSDAILAFAQTLA